MVQPIEGDPRTLALANEAAAYDRSRTVNACTQASHQYRGTHLHARRATSRDGRGVRLVRVLSLAKLASTDQRYYLDQTGARVDHTGSVSSGAEDYYLGGPEAAGRWTGSATRQLGLRGEVGEAQLRAVLSQHRVAAGSSPARRRKRGCRASI